MSNFCFEWSKDGLCINVAGEWLNAKETRNYLKHKNVAETVFMGTSWGVILFVMLAKHKSLSVLLVVAKNMKGYKMKKNEIMCDLCDKVVARKDDTCFAR